MKPSSTSRVVQLFLDLVQIDSESGNERAIARVTKDMLEDLGFDVTIDDAQTRINSNSGNVIAHRSGDIEGVRIGFCAHLDQVPPCNNVKPQFTDDGYIVSDGTTTLGADDKSGIAPIFEGITRALEDDLKLPDIDVLFTVREETGLQGSKNVDVTPYKENDLFLVLDSDGPVGAVVTGAPGYYSLKATFYGTSAHAGAAPEKGNSAICMAAEAIEDFPQGRIDEYTTANIGIVSGGSALNAVPSTCVVEAECRSLQKDKLLDVKNQIDEIFKNAAHKNNGNVSLEWELEYPGYFFSEASPEIAFLFNAARSANITPQVMISGGGSDANVLSGKGLNTLVLATGMDNFHSTKERIKVSELEDLSCFVYQILKNASDGIKV